MDESAVFKDQFLLKLIHDNAYRFGTWTNLKANLEVTRPTAALEPLSELRGNCMYEIIFSLYNVDF